ncbi:MAG: hypothetical protein GY928_30220 [Colwellia sp.]|nr:hypothetical protein [Colwellia sp.]
MTDLDESISSCFPPYEMFEPHIPVCCVTPDLDGCFHRFFDSCPISPSGRFIGLTRLRDESRAPSAGEAADIVLVDLNTGTQAIIAESHAFATQLGAQVQWGRSDEELYFNDMRVGEWKPFAVCMNPATGKKREMQGPIYMISPDGKTLASPCLLRTALTQNGYGVHVPEPHLPFNMGAPDDDGLYVTDTESGECRLLVSFHQIVAALGDHYRHPPYSDGGFYGFHVKWNRQGTRLMFILRYRHPAGGGHTAMPCDVITCDADGSNINVALTSAQRFRGGHHPDWCPDGEHITQNLVVNDTGLRFVRFCYDGTNLETLSDRPGSGHPTLHPDGRHILTDAYVPEKVSFGDGTTPIRWIDIQTNEEITLARIGTSPAFNGPENMLRVDPHPAWDRTYTRFVFNACPDGCRKVFLADVSSLLENTDGAEHSA